MENETSQRVSYGGSIFKVYDGQSLYRSLRGDTLSEQYDAFRHAECQASFKLRALDSLPPSPPSIAIAVCRFLFPIERCSLTVTETAYKTHGCLSLAPTKLQPVALSLWGYIPS